MDARVLKAEERRRKIRKYLRKNLSEVEMAEKLGVDTTTISEDISIISQENQVRMQSNQKLLDENISASLDALKRINELDEEVWSIYYGKRKVVVKGTGGIERIEEVEYDPLTRLQALEKIRQLNVDRARILKLLNPTQINIERLVYVEKMIPVLIERVVNVALEYVPKEQQEELLTKLKAIDVEKEISDGRESST